MPLIHLTTVIHAPLHRVFDLSRSITLHKRSMEHLQEEAVKGRTSGLIEYDETVTWRAKHLTKNAGAHREDHRDAKATSISRMKW